MKFCKADVPDQHQLEMAILCTATSIYESPAARNYRSLHQIIDVVEQGIIAEQYLVQVCGFTDESGRYNDVCRGGYSWEIKAWTVKPGFVERIDPLIDKLRGWRKQFTGKRTYKPSKLAIFGVKNGQYRLFNCYEIDSGTIIDRSELTDTTKQEKTL